MCSQENGYDIPKIKFNEEGLSETHKMEKHTHKNNLYLEVCQLWVFLFENISHVIDQMQTKGIFGGDFLPKEKKEA